MFDIAGPATVKGEVLDNYLSMGWFRIGSIIYTADSTSLNDKDYPVFWLRYNVKATLSCKKNTKLISQNRHFTIHCHPLEINKEIEGLFKKYRKSVKFEINPTLQSILGDNTTFDSMVMEVRDNSRLIAAGIFDIGKTSIEHIISIYDPAYHKYSLGKFLIVSIYKYCLENGFEYYYPGYYIPGQQVLSYKLFLDKKATEVYLFDEKLWICFGEFVTR